MSYKNTVKDYSQMIGFLTRDKTTDVPGSMAHGLRTGLYDGGRAGFDAGGEVEKRTKIITNAVNKYNKLFNDALAKKDISKIPPFQGWFTKNYPDIPPGTANKYINQEKVKVRPLIRDEVKYDFIQQLVDEANAKDKHTKWIDIESKVTDFGKRKFKRADTNLYREYIDQLDNIEDKYYKAFQNILDNPDEPLNLTFKKYPSETTGIGKTSFLKKYLYEQVQAGVPANIKKALDSHPFYSKNKDLIEKYAFYSGTTGGEGRSFQGKTFNEAMQFGKDNMGGKVIFSGGGKTKGPAEDIYNFALRSWDTSNRQQKPVSEQKIQFFDKKTNKPIKWGDVPRGKDNSKKLKINDVYFKYKDDAKNTKWDIETVRGKGKASGLFDEVYDSFKAYQTLINTKVDNPFGKGKVNLSEVIEKVAEKGYGKTASVYGLAKDHQLGVSNEPFKKIRIIPQRLNLTLKQIGDIKGSDKFKKDLTNELLQEFKGLKGTKYNQAVQNNILNLAKEVNEGYTTTDSGYTELGKKIVSDSEKLKMYSPQEQVYIKQMAGEISPYKAGQILAQSKSGPKLAQRYIPVLQKISKTGGAKGKAAARALSIIAAGVGGYKMEDILKGTGLMDKEYELTASAGDAPLVEKGLSTGEKVAAGTAAAGTIGTKTGRKILGKGLNLAFGPTGMVGLNVALGTDPKESLDRVGLGLEAAFAPSLVKGVTDVSSKIKNPLLRKGIETLAGVRIPGVMNPANALKIARVASPLGIATLGGEALYNYGKFAKNEIDRVRAMPEDERRAYNEALMDEGSMFEYE